MRGNPYAWSPASWFVLDASGALLSFLLLYLVLPAFYTWIGMPIPVLKTLAWIAFAFFIYSACCSVWVRKGWRTGLRLISAANMGYVVITLMLVLLHLDHLTALGVLYFVSEMAIIAALARMEWLRAGK
jgi:hypothetical protein